MLLIDPFDVYKALSDSLENHKIMNCIVFSIILKPPNMHHKTRTKKLCCTTFYSDIV